LAVVRAGEKAANVQHTNKLACAALVHILDAFACVEHCYNLAFRYSFTATGSNVWMSFWGIIVYPHQYSALNCSVAFSEA
jgi:hypothetical protein